MTILTDFIKAYETVRSRRKLGIQDLIHYRTVWEITRWNSEEDRTQRRIYSPGLAREMFGGFPQFGLFTGNLMLNEGLNQLWTILCSSGGTKYDSSNAQCGTGTSSTGETAGDSSLTAAVWKGMMASFPTYGTGQQAVWKSEFTSGEANQAWNEFSVRNGASADLMLNRKVSSQGTKASGQTWELTITITLS